MKIYEEKRLKDFQFWGDAECYAEDLTPEQFDELEIILAETFPFGVDNVTLNSLFEYEPDEVAKMLGFDDWEHLERVNNEEQ